MQHLQCDDKQTTTLQSFRYLDIRLSESIIVQDDHTETNNSQWVELASSIYHTPKAWPFSVLPTRLKQLWTLSYSIPRLGVVWDSTCMLDTMRVRTTVQDKEVLSVTNPCLYMRLQTILQSQSVDEQPCSQVICIVIDLSLDLLLVGGVPVGGCCATHRTPPPDPTVPFPDPNL